MVLARSKIAQRNVHLRLATMDLRHCRIRCLDNGCDVLGLDWIQYGDSIDGHFPGSTRALQPQFLRLFAVLFRYNRCADRPLVRVTYACQAG